MLVGRAAEFARLTDLVSSVNAGDGASLVLCGAAGIGKTALLHAVAAHDDLRVLSASGVQSESRMAFAGLHELLQPVLGAVDALAPHARMALRRCLGLDTGDIDDKSSRLALTMLLSGLSRHRAVVCLLDDAHWLDESSADAILFAARRHPERVGFLIAVRSGQPSRFDEPWLPRMPIGPLPDAESRELVHCTAPSLTPAQARSVVSAGEGNPLALVEFASSASAEQSWQSPARMMPISERLEQSFAQQAQALPPATRQGLLLLSVSEVDEPGPVSAALAQCTGDPCALDPAIDAGLVATTGVRIHFRHPLVRSAVFQSASASARRAAHSEWARALRPTHPAQAAWHQALASDAPDESVASALEETAEAARRRGGHAGEARALERAARLTPEPVRMTNRLLAAARAALEASDHDMATTLLEEVVARTRDPIVLADAEHELATLAFWEQGRRRTSLLEAAALVAPVDSRRAARLLSQQLVSLISDYEARQAEPIARRVWELIDGGCEPLEVAFRVAHVLLMAGRTAEGAGLVERVYQAAQEAGNLTALTNIAQALIWLERYSDARAALETAESRLRAVDGFWMLGHALVVRAELDRRLGRLASARVASAEALALAEQLGEPMQQAEALIQLAAAESDLGRLVEARAHAQHALRLAAQRECGTGELHALSALALGRGALACGDPAAAVDALAASVHRIRSAGVADPAVVPGAADLVEAYVATGRRAEAAELLGWFSGQAHACGRRWACLAALRCDVLMDRPDAQHLLLEALAADDGQAGLETARGWLVLGCAQRRSGRRGDAVELLHRAHQLFSAAGAATWAARTGQELQACGRSPSGSSVDPLTTLTPAETRVVRLVATGARNREVAAALFVSAKTVETHLSAAYRKLGVRSRAELAARFAAAGTQG